MMCTLYPSTEEAEVVGLWELQDSLVYIASSKSARTTQGDFVSKDKWTKLKYKPLWNKWTGDSNYINI